MKSEILPVSQSFASCWQIRLNLGVDLCEIGIVASYRLRVGIHAFHVHVSVCVRAKNTGPQRPALERLSLSLKEVVQLDEKDIVRKYGKRITKLVAGGSVKRRSRKDTAVKQPTLCFAHVS